MKPSRPSPQTWSVSLLIVATMLAMIGGRVVLLRSVGPRAADVDAAGTPEPTAPPRSAPTPDRGDLWASAVPAVLADEVTAVVAGQGEDPGLLASTRLLERAPVAVVSSSDTPAWTLATWLALRLRAPLLAADPRPPSAVDPLAATLDALGVDTIVAVGEIEPPTTATEVLSVLPVAGDPRPWTARHEQPIDLLRSLREARTPPGPADLSAVAPLLLAAAGADATLGDAVALVRPGDRYVAAAVSAYAAGHEVVLLRDPDPRADGAARSELTGLGHERSILLGSAVAWEGVDPEQLAWQLATVRRGLELPGGGQRLFPDRRLVALYGSPGTPALGALGEQDVDAAIDRARRLAEDYAVVSEAPVVPTFEIIATVASASPQPTGDYSWRVDPAVIGTWVDAAEAAGVYVLLDLQPGRTDFLTQARELESLVVRPHVGLALDPEWRLGPTQRHLRQVGSVDVEEVNAVVHWLADLTRAHALPQKLLVVHQFKLSMIRGRERLETRPEVAVLIQMDGQGSQGGKDGTWRAITTLSPPAGVWWGWKNFYDEDVPGPRSPAATLGVAPTPFFVSYQ